MKTIFKWSQLIILVIFFFLFESQINLVNAEDNSCVDNCAVIQSADPVIDSFSGSGRVRTLENGSWGGQASEIKPETQQSPSLMSRLGSIVDSIRNLFASGTSEPDSEPVVENNYQPPKAIEILKGEDRQIALKEFIDSGLDKIRSGDYGEAIDHFKNEGKATELGISLQGRSVIFFENGGDFDQYIKDFNYVHVVTSMSDKPTESEGGRIGIAVPATINLENFDPQARTNYGIFDDTFLLNVALVNAEEWVHQLSFSSEGGTITGHKDQEHDAAQYYIDTQVPVTDAFMSRYNRQEAVDNFDPSDPSTFNTDNKILPQVAQTTTTVPVDSVEDAFDSQVEVAPVVISGVVQEENKDMLTTSEAEQAASADVGVEGGEEQGIERAESQGEETVPETLSSSAELAAISTVGTVQTVGQIADTVIDNSASLDLFAETGINSDSLSTKIDEVSNEANNEYLESLQKANSHNVSAVAVSEVRKETEGEVNISGNSSFTIFPNFSLGPFSIFGFSNPFFSSFSATSTSEVSTSATDGTQGNTRERDYVPQYLTDPKTNDLGKIGVIEVNNEPDVRGAPEIELNPQSDTPGASEIELNPQSDTPGAPEIELNPQSDTPGVIETVVNTDDVRGGGSEAVLQAVEAAVGENVDTYGGYSSDYSSSGGFSLDTLLNSFESNDSSSGGGSNFMYIKPSIFMGINDLNILPNLVGKIYAKDQVTNIKNNIQTNKIFYSGQVVDLSTYALLKTSYIVQNKLKVSNVTSDEIKDIYKENLLVKPMGMRDENQLILTTGSNGIVDFVADPGVYILDAISIPNKDIFITSEINIKGDDNVIGVGITDGTGKVIRKDPNLAKISNSESNQVKVKIVTFNDKNKNSIIDKNEQLLPWSGVTIKLTNKEGYSTLNLISGWNLISFNQIPLEIHSASDLLLSIAKQGGYATSVSTLESSAWKTYVARGTENYNIDNFAIVPRRAYFVKVIKNTEFKYKYLTEPFPNKISLKEGWNAIGLPISKFESADNFISRIGNQNLSMSQWNSGQWESIVRNKNKNYGKDYPLSGKYGYVIKSETDLNIQLR